MIPPSPSDYSGHVSAFPDRTAVSPRRMSPARHVPDLICLSHLRWDFVFQRPQHLMTRAARDRRVFFIEEPIFDAASGEQSVDIRQPQRNVFVVVPHLVASETEASSVASQQAIIDELLRTYDVSEYVLWYWTPMSLTFTRHLTPTAIVYDCMDELSGFAGASPRLKQLERELMARANLMFTGGVSLYEAKRAQHPHVHAFPSSVDAAHFARARHTSTEPTDQAAIPKPRIGFFGVIDERMDLELIAGVADLRPDWHLVLLGPTVKIDPASRPSRPNIHYLGMKAYDQLPEYLAGWDVAMLPFARNDATRYISPTKTPEYLAAGCPVVSTSIRDVVRPYGELGLVHVADEPVTFAQAIERALREDAAARHRKVDATLAGNSWDVTWSRMSALIAAECVRATVNGTAATTPALTAQIASVAHV